ncbi:hypothetical protein AB1L88_24840, partial [Tautonia sp. JC769]|uniref:hypothetical protein n=1 Tax=Tautonia sp. JC769 TaxID=3232135 RepID=UPI003459DAA3
MTRRLSLLTFGAWLIAVAVAANPASADEPTTACALKPAATKACCATEVKVTLTSTTVAEAK